LEERLDYRFLAILFFFRLRSAAIPCYVENFD